MSHLPEDLNQWPSDPFDVLNIERSDDARTAKRAYFKLIRKFKPDRCPAEFQVIRQAYESVEDWLSWQSHVQDDSADSAGEAPVVNETPVATPVAVGDQSTTSGDESVYTAELIEEGESRIASADPLSRFFKSLNSAGLAEAVGHINKMDPSSGTEQRARANLIKYYIARFSPGSKASLQPNGPEQAVSTADQKRIAWLLKSVRYSSSSHAALIELRDEFDRKRGLADCEIFNRCLKQIEDPSTLGNLYRLRWRAIGHHQPLTVVADVKRLQPRALEFGGNQGIWMDLISDSLNYTLWHQHDRCREHNETYWREIAENDQSWVADSTELLVLAAEQWQTMHSKWTPLIPWARNGLPQTKRSMWLPVAEEIAADPRASLNELDEHFRTGSIAMSIFEEGLRDLESSNPHNEDVERPDWDEMRELVSCFFLGNFSTTYAANRIPIMEFCVFNQISPENFAAAANSFMSENALVGWSELINADGPLKCVVHACRAVAV